MVASVEKGGFHGHILLAVIALTSVSLLWIAGINVPVLTSEPLDFTGDAHHYLAAATSLVDSGNLTDASNKPLTLFPPGFPILIAIPLFAGVPTHLALFFINALSIFLIIFITYWIGIRILPTKWAALVVAALVGVNPSVLRTAAFVLSEMPFSVVTGAVLLLAVITVQRQHMTRWQFVLFVALIWIAISFKFLGVALIVPFAWALLSSLTSAKQSNRWLRVALASFLASAALVPILLRNLGHGSGPFGDRREAYITIEGALSGGLGALGRIVIQPDSSGLSEPIGIALAMLFVVAIWIAWLRNNPGIQALGIGVAAYFLVLWVSQTRTHVDADIERFVVPVMGSVMVVLAWSLINATKMSQELLLRKGRGYLSRMVVVGVVVVVATLFSLSLLKSILLAMQLSAT